MSITRVILMVMKTAISIPDNIFKAADQYAKSHGVSRSELYTKAVIQFLQQHPSDHITKKLDKIYSSSKSEMDSVLSAMQLSSIEKEEW